MPPVFLSPVDQDLPAAVQDLVITEEDDLTRETSANNLVEEEEAEAYLFDSHLIESVDVEKVAPFKNKISASKPGKNLRMRALGTGDYKRSELELNILTVFMIRENLFKKE